MTNEQKMREALERIAHKVATTEWTRYEVEACAREALAQQPAVVELTDAEIDGFFEDHGWCPDEMYYTVVRDIIAAHEAKQGGAA